MKKSEKTVILILVILTLIVTIMYFMQKNKGQKKNNDEVEVEKQNEIVEEKFVEILKDGTKLNKSNKLQTNKNVDGFEISDIQITYKDGLTVLLANIKNTTGTKTKLKQISISLLDEKGKEIDVVNSLIEGLDVNETAQLNIVVTSDYANVYDFKAEIK